MRLFRVSVLVALVLPLGLCAEEVTSQAILQEIREMRQAYESRISTLESEIKTLKSAHTDAKRTVDIQKGIDKALGEPGTASKAASTYLSNTGLSGVVRSASNMTLGGYTEFTYVDREDRTTAFDQLRTVLEFGAQIHERINLYIELEYEHGGVIHDGGTDGELELEQAWVDLQFSDAINLRAGVILNPVSRYNLYHESFVNNLVDRPLIGRRITPTTWWEEGMGLHGQVLDNDVLGISYEAYVFNPGRADRISSSGFRNLRLNSDAPIYDTKKAGAGRVTFEPRVFKDFADHLEIGFATYISEFGGRRASASSAKLGGDGTVQIYSADLTYEKSFGNKRKLGFRGEAAMANVTAGRTHRARGQQGWGYYAEGFYEFWPSFLDQSTFGRDFPDSKLIFALRHEFTDLDLDRFDQSDMSRTTVGLSWRPVERVVYKLDYQMDVSRAKDGPGHPDSGSGTFTDAFLFSVAVGF